MSAVDRLCDVQILNGDSCQITDAHLEWITATLGRAREDRAELHDPILCDVAALQSLSDLSSQAALLEAVTDDPISERHQARL